jgi:hypothetical protein
MTKLASLLSVLLLAGCMQTVWVKNGASRAQFEQYKAGCMLEAAHAVPRETHEELAEAGKRATHTECKDEKRHIDCREVTTYSPAQYRTVDANDDLRTQVYRACMYRQGWQEQQFDDDTLQMGVPGAFAQ